MKLTHLGISQFRSIGETPVIIDLEKKITVLVGQNDCGKSNVLKGLEWVSELRPNGEWLECRDIDKHKRQPHTYPQVHLTGLANEQDHDAVKAIGKLSAKAPVRKNLEGAESQEVDDLTPAMFEPLAMHIGVGSSFVHPNEPETRKRKREVTKYLASPLLEVLTKFLIVPEFRRINKTTPDYAISGDGIIRLLASWQNNELGHEHLRPKFDRVVKLLRVLIERPNVTLDVPRSEKEILVDDDGLRLPLESHGTGIHQLIILAIAVLSEDNVIFGIEEPEIHLHPVLQRRFLAFLKEETTNRYVITTHSPSLIAPAEDVDVIHLKMVDGVTIPTRVATDAHTLEALHDLGIRPSDLLQANCVIWVEGPSDRIYLLRWLELLAPGLKEGIDFSIMFYGGRLLAHLTMEREEAEKELPHLINLLRINQHSALVMDSDRKKSAGDPINDTKQRLVSECAKNNLHTWVTDGKEIENYLPPRAVEDALKAEELFKQSFTLLPFGKFENAMNEAMIKNPPAWSQYDKHKPDWAHRIAPHMQAADLGGDLKERLHALIEFIQRRVRSS